MRFTLSNYYIWFFLGYYAFIFTNKQMQPNTNQIRLHILQLVVAYYASLLGFITPLFGIFDLIIMRIASSNISLSPSWVKALHSKYLLLNSSSMIFLAVSFSMGAFFGSLFLALASFLKSILFPIKILGTLGQVSFSSGYHWFTILKYFFASVHKSCWVRHWKSDEEYVAVGISKRSQSVVFFLTGCVPEFNTKRTRVRGLPSFRPLSLWPRSSRRLSGRIPRGNDLWCSWSAHMSFRRSRRQRSPALLGWVIATSLLIKILCGGKSLITVKNPTQLANNNSQN